MNPDLSIISVCIYGISKASLSRHYRGHRRLWLVNMIFCFGIDCLLRPPTASPVRRLKPESEFQHFSGGRRYRGHRARRARRGTAIPPRSLNPSTQRSQLQTLIIYKLGFNQNDLTFTLMLPIKIVLCCKFSWTKFINYKCFDMRFSMYPFREANLPLPPERW